VKFTHATTVWVWVRLREFSDPANIIKTCFVQVLLSFSDSAAQDVASKARFVSKKCRMSSKSGEFTSSSNIDSISARKRAQTSPRENQHFELDKERKALSKDLTLRREHKKSQGGGG
jgi:hypothetical protein